MRKEVYFCDQCKVSIEEIKDQKGWIEFSVDDHYKNFKIWVTDGRAENKMSKNKFYYSGEELHFCSADCMLKFMGLYDKTGSE